MLPLAASEFYRAQQRLTVATLALTRTAWARMDLGAVEATWAQVGPVLTTVVSSAQTGAARNGAAMVPAVLDELGQTVAPDAIVAPEAFAGFASDGRGLASLLEGAKVRAVESGSLELGGKWLDMAAHTMVSDAGRQSASVAGFARPRVGFVRVANAPCCQRCAVLSGKFTRAEAAFNRHPRCDCFNVPTSDPASITAPVIGPDDVKDLTASQRKAIADGADFNKVVNSHRAGKRNGLTTTEGAKRGAKRLTPEGIYRVASDRDEALRLLRSHGYVL